MEEERQTRGCVRKWHINSGRTFVATVRSEDTRAGRTLKKVGLPRRDARQRDMYAGVDFHTRRGPCRRNRASAATWAAKLKHNSGSARARREQRKSRAWTQSLMGAHAARKAILEVMGAIRGPLAPPAHAGRRQEARNRRAKQFHGTHITIHLFLFTLCT